MTFYGIFDSCAAPIRRKLRASVAPALRERIDGLSARILIGRGASAAGFGSARRFRTPAGRRGECRFPR